MRLPWKQTAPIKRHAINLAAGLNSLCLHRVWQTAPGDFWRADISRRQRWPSGRLAATTAPWGYGIRKASNKERQDRCQFSLARLFEICASLLLAGDGAWTSCIRSIVPLRWILSPSVLPT